MTRRQSMFWIGLPVLALAVSAARSGRGPRRAPLVPVVFEEAGQSGGRVQRRRTTTVRPKVLRIDDRASGVISSAPLPGFGPQAGALLRTRRAGRSIRRGQVRVDDRASLAQYQGDAS